MPAQNEKDIDNNTAKSDRANIAFSLRNSILYVAAPCIVMNRSKIRYPGMPGPVDLLRVWCVWGRFLGGLATFLTIAMFPPALLPAADPPSLLPPFMEKLELWDNQLNMTRPDQATLDRVAGEIPGYMKNLESMIVEGNDDAAAAWLAARRLRGRLSRTLADGSSMLEEAIGLVRIRAAKGDPTFQYILWQHRDDAGLSLDESDKLLKDSALGGCSGALSAAVWGNDFLSSQMELESDAEYYKISILYAGVLARLRSTSLGFDEMFKAAERARAEMRDRQDTAGNVRAPDPLFSIEQEALGLLRKMNWENLRRNAIFLVDTSQR